MSHLIFIFLSQLYWFLKFNYDHECLPIEPDLYQMHQYLCENENFLITSLSILFYFDEPSIETFENNMLKFQKLVSKHYLQNKVPHEFQIYPYRLD